MTLNGHVRGGVIVLDPPVALPEGAQVHVSVVQPLPDPDSQDGNHQTLGEMLLKYAGKAKGLPADLSRCHDHYIHGTPRE